MRDKPAIYKASEWQDPNGDWHVNDTSDIAGIAGLWWVPARILGLEPASYIQWLIDNYHPDRLTWNGKLLLFSWNKEHYSVAHKYLLYINKVARNKNFKV